MGDIKQRKSIANYLNVPKPDAGGTYALSDNYVLMGAGFTELNESPSAQVSSKKYVNDKSATKRIIGYDWSTAFNTDQIRSEEAIEFICRIGEEQLVGSACETDYIIVDLDKSAGEGAFKARKFKVAIEISSFDNNDGEMAASGNLLGIGDVELGKFSITDNTFTKDPAKSE